MLSATQDAVVRIDLWVDRDRAVLRQAHVAQRRAHEAREVLREQLVQDRLQIQTDQGVERYDLPLSLAHRGL